MRRAKESMKSPQSKKIPETSQIQQSESLEKLLSRYKAIVSSKHPKKVAQNHHSVQVHRPFSGIDLFLLACAGQKNR